MSAMLASFLLVKTLVRRGDFWPGERNPFLLVIVISEDYCTSMGLVARIMKGKNKEFLTFI